MRSFALKCLLLLFAVQSAYAQQFPVTASTQIIPPYSVYLPDYAVPGTDKLRVILIQNDLTQPSYDVILQMTVEQNGTLIMRTAGTFHPRPLTLSAGVPTIISGADLSECLSTNNIDFSGGFSRENYDRTKALPEGAYRITFTAFDYRRPTVQVSNAGSNIFFFKKNDPPLLNLPICGSRVEKHDPQFLSFNWSSRNTPNSSTEYVFSLYEIKPKNTNADYIVKSAQPLYTQTTESNTLIYGPGEPQLIDSMEYVWIVQARDKDGRDLFSNQGYSQSCKFTYLGTNPFQVLHINKPLLYGESNGERSLKFWWPLSHSNQYQVESYRLQYRAAANGAKEYDWYTEEYSRDSSLTLHSLEPGRSYEARLQWRIAGVYSAYSELLNVTTDSLRVFSCGDGSPLQLPANSQPLPSAIVGNIIRVGLFDVMLTSVTGGNGVFSGTGRVITPGFGMGLPMTFTSISVNTDLVVIRGEMQAVTSGINKFVSEELKNQRGGDDVGQVKTGDIVPALITKLHLFTKDNIGVDTTSGTITLKDGKGGNETIHYTKDAKTLPLIIEDADGHLFNIDKNGTVTDAGTRDKSINTATLNRLDLSRGRITFSAAANNKYAFDTWKNAYTGKSILDSSYELIDGYRVSAKAIVPGAQEAVIATLQNINIDTATIKFVSGKGIAYPFIKKGNQYTVTITGGPAGDAQEIFAVYGNNTSIGKLLVASYAPKQQKIMLIPVGANTSVPEAAIKTSLEKAYGKIGITYSVETDQTFRTDITWDKNGDQVLQDSHSTFLGNGFTAEELAMKKAYAKTHAIENNVSYLFLVNEATLSNGDLLGKMPRQSQFGFVFVRGATAEAIGRTVAHEAGHGAYTLEHTFSEGIGLSMGSTDNLMDYKEGYELLKYQWDILHDPGHVWGVFEHDAGTESQYLKSLPVSFLDKDNTYTFLTYNGQFISLPKTAKNFLFHFGITDYKSNIDMVTGVLEGFEIDGQVFSTKFEGQTFKYQGSKGSVYENVKTAATDGVIMAMPYEASLKVYKIWATGLSPYQSSSPATISSEFQFPVLPFSKNNSILNDAKGQPLSLTLNNRSADCQYCYDEVITKTVSSSKEKIELLYVSKIAQIRKAYPVLFAQFTSEGNDWAKPDAVFTGDFMGASKVPKGIWGKKISDQGNQLSDLYNDADTRHLFFKQMLTELTTYVEGTVKRNEFFFDTLTVRCDIKKVIAAINNSSQYECGLVKWNSRKTALMILSREKVLSADIYPYHEQALAIVKLLTYLGDTPAEDVLNAFNDPRIMPVIDDLLQQHNDDKLYADFVSTMLTYLSKSKGVIKDHAATNNLVFNYISKQDTYVRFAPMEFEGANIKFYYKSYAPPIKDKSGKITLTLPDTEAYEGTVRADAYESIILLLQDDFKINGEVIFRKADYPNGVKMSAIQFYWYYRLRVNSSYAQFKSFMWNMPLLMLPAEAASAKGWRLILAIADLELIVHNLLANTGRYTEIYNTYPDAREYMDLLQAANHVYCIGRVTQVGGAAVIGIGKSLSRAAATLKNVSTVPAEVKAELLVNNVIEEEALAAIEESTVFAQGMDKEEQIALIINELNCTEKVAEQIFERGGIVFAHVPTSGAKVFYSAKKGTFLVGSWQADLRYILDELDYPVVTDIAVFEGEVAFQVPEGHKFNLLNTSEEVVNYFGKRGGFFTLVNAKWVDAAVAQKVDIVIISDVHEYLYTQGKSDEMILTGFGKEIHRFEWKHGFRYNPETQMMVAPDKAGNLPTLTQKSDNVIK